MEPIPDDGKPHAQLQDTTQTSQLLLLLMMMLIKCSTIKKVVFLFFGSLVVNC